MTSQGRLTVLVEPSDYVLRNAGDMAMMHVAAQRLAAMWPEADIRVLSDAPDEMVSSAANVTAMDATGRGLWLRTPLVPEQWIERSPHRVTRLLARSSRWLRVRHPHVAAAFVRRRLRNRAEDRRKLAEYLSFLYGADLVLATGMGGVTDVFPEYAFELLETLDAAKQSGAVTAMMGQGMGPLHDHILRSYARRVMSHVDVIGLREGRKGRPLLIDDFGIEHRRVVTTGDDAIELAADHAPDRSGSLIGVNLRVSYYSGLTEAAASDIGAVLRRCATELGAGLVAAPISSVVAEDDRSTVGRFVLDMPAPRPSGKAWTTSDAMAAIARCRVLVTGSYHGAVFALSMGIPAVAISASSYYEDKFLGLLDQFGAGCYVVFADSDSFDLDLEEKLRLAWRRADDVRPSLRKAARRQISLGHQAYDTVRQIVESRRVTRCGAHEGETSK
jgi:colanic acid/amylovoran biosynthesis protein